MKVRIKVVKYVSSLDKSWKEQHVLRVLHLKTILIWNTCFYQSVVLMSWFFSGYLECCQISFAEFENELKLLIDVYMCPKYTHL